MTQIIDTAQTIGGSITIPASVQENDLIVVSMLGLQVIGATPPNITNEIAGFNTAASHQVSDNSAGPWVGYNAKIFYKRATLADAGQIYSPVTGAQVTVGSASVIRWPNATDFISDYSDGAHGVYSVAGTGPSITDAGGRANTGVIFTQLFTQNTANVNQSYSPAPDLIIDGVIMLDSIQLYDSISPAINNGATRKAFLAGGALMGSLIAGIYAQGATPPGPTPSPLNTVKNKLQWAECRNLTPDGELHNLTVNLIGGFEKWL